MKISTKEYRRWLERRRLRPRTVEAYVYTIEKALEGSPLEYLQNSQSSGRRQQIYAALKHYAGYLISDDRAQEGGELLAALEALPPWREAEKPPERPLDEEEWNRLLYQGVYQQEEPTRQALAVLVITGLRVSDVLQIEREKVLEGLRTGTVYLQQKGGGYRPFPCQGDLANVFDELVIHWQWTVLWKAITKGKKQRAAYMVLYRALKEAADDAGLNSRSIHPHLLRATAAVQLYRRSGKDILAVKAWLGHRSITTTQKYLRYIDEEELGDLYDRLEQGRRSR
jgi:integrase